jgi:excisionase family DNA binding protein
MDTVTKISEVDKLQDSYTPAEVADILRVHKKTVYMWCENKVLPHYKFGLHIYVYKKDLEQFIADKKIETD